MSSGSSSYGSASSTASTRYSSGASHASGSSYTSNSSYTPSTSYTTMSTSSNVMPFSTSVSNMSDYQIAGMGSNESLRPTTCPTSVYNPDGAKVLGCYSVVKPAPVMRPAPIVVPQTSYQHVRVVRPIVYVRYPVPTPYAVPVYRQQYRGCGTTYSRYGNNWPRLGGSCGN